MAPLAAVARSSLYLLLCAANRADAHLLRWHGAPHGLEQRAPQLATSAPATVTVSSSVPVASRVVADVVQILDGLSNLRKDLQSFLQQVQGDLSQLVAVLQALIDALGSSDLSPPPASSTSSNGLPIGFPGSTDTSTPVGSLTVSRSLLPSLSHYGPPSQDTSDATTTIRRTSTIHITRTVTGYSGASTSRPTSIRPDSTTLQSTVSAVPQPRFFNRNATNNVAAYYNFLNAPDANTTMESLQLLCDEPAIDIINLAWAETFIGPQYGGAPGYGMAFPCGSINCTAVGYQATRCQEKGKQVFISLVVNATHGVSVGGNNGTSPRGPGSAAQLLGSGVWAQNFAAGLLQTFGTGTSNNSGALFGNLVVDGFDIYPVSSFPVNTATLTPGSNSTNIFLTTPYDVQFVQALRQEISTKSRTYYISAAPYCGASETPLSLEALRLVDFVYVRYLDTPGCSLKDPSLDLGDSLHQWSSDLLGLTNGPGSTPAEFPGPGSSAAVDKGPRLFFGGLAPNGSLQLDNTTVYRWQNLYRYLNPTNAPDQGGVMLWGAPEDIERQGRAGRTFAAYAKGQVGCLDSEFRSVACGSLSG